MSPLVDIKRLSLIPKRPNQGVEENWCLTDNMLTRLSCVWTITNFSYYKEGETAISPEFTSKTDDRLKWKLNLLLKSVRNPKYTSCFDEWIMIAPLFNTDQLKSGLKTNCTLSILKADGQEAKKINFRDSITSEQPALRQFIQKDTLCDKTKGLLQDDKLTIYCRIDVLIQANQYSGEVKRFEWKVPACTLADDLIDSLKNDEEFSDVIIKVGGREFKAHKFILAARSPVFKKMLSSLMKEKNLSQVDVLDVEPHVFEEMLTFMYTGRLSFDSELVKQEVVEGATIDIEHLASELLKVAEKYQLDELKLRCERTLGEGLTIQTAAEILALADFYNAQQLKAKTIQFIVINVDQVIRTDGWKKMVSESSPQLVADVFAEHISSMEPTCKDSEKPQASPKE